MAILVPVFYVDRQGNETPDTVNGEPVLEIGFSWDPVAGDAITPHPAAWETVRALIDTGAQAIVADAGLINRWGAPWHIEVLNRTSTNSSPTRGYLCQLHFPYGPWTSRNEVFSAPLREQGHPFDLLLGRDFLRNCTFRSGPNGITEFAVVTPTASIIARS